MHVIEVFLAITGVTPRVGDGVAEGDGECVGAAWETLTFMTGFEKLNP